MPLSLCPKQDSGFSLQHSPAQPCSPPWDVSSSPQIPVSIHNYSREGEGPGGGDISCGAKFDPPISHSGGSDSASPPPYRGDTSSFSCSFLFLHPPLHPISHWPSALNLPTPFLQTLTPSSGGSSSQPNSPCAMLVSIKVTEIGKKKRRVSLLGEEVALQPTFLSFRTLQPQGFNIVFLTAWTT